MKDLAIEKLVAGGEGLGHLDGKAVFVPGVLPGERVSVSIVERRKDYDRAALQGVIEPSRYRMAPPGCRFAGVCGGCDWLHISYDEQLRQKVLTVQETLLRIGRIRQEAIPIEPSPAWGCRNRTQIHRDEQGALGYMAARSNRIVAIDACPIVAGPINRVFTEKSSAPEGLDRFTVFASDENVSIEGRDDNRDIAARVCGRDIFFSIGCFFQANLAVLERLVPWALEGLSGDAAADLYCGVGLFGSFIADRFARIICVESSAMSLSYARRNVAGFAGRDPVRGRDAQAITHEFHPLSLEQWIASGAAPRPGAGALDAVIVDPPRPGLGVEVREYLAAAAPRRLVYVSCNPVTLARDLGALIIGGYILEEMRLFDFYPQTSHVEAVAKLSHAGSPT
ncbi:MAG: class I SAM-dependent RNA methyltransferase [Spirochaetia bacterium]